MDIARTLYYEFVTCLRFSIIIFAILYFFKYIVQFRNQRLYGTPITLNALTITGWVLLTATFLGAYRYAVNASEHWNSSVRIDLPNSILYAVFYVLFPMAVFLLFLFHLIQAFFFKEIDSRVNFDGYTLAVVTIFCSVLLIVVTNIFNRV